MRCGAHPPTPHLMNDTQLLFDAAQKGDTATVRRYLTMGYSPDSLNEKGYSLLSESVKQPDIMQLLIDAGADVNLRDQSDMCPIHSCADYQVADSIEILIRAGADMYAETSFYTDADTIGTLSADSCGGSMAALKRLLACGCDINHRTSPGKSMLMTAVGSNWERATRWLLAHGAETELRDNEGETALFYGASTNIYRCTESLDVLMEAGADINATNNLGNNALQAIAHLPLGEEKTHEYLIEHGIDLHHHNKAGQSAFDIARAHNNQSLMKLLISLKAD